MSLRQSFQLPDLLTLISSLELRTNPHCRIASEASEEWITKTRGILLLSEEDLLLLRSTKIGLLAALCFPTCDAPQLRLLIDFMSLLLYSGIQLYADDKSGSEKDNELSMPALQATGAESGVTLLRRHGLMKHAVNDRIGSLAERAPASWNSRFKASIEQFYSSREQVVRYGTPSLEEYILLRRQMYGGSITLDLAELLEMFTIPEVEQHAQGLLDNIRRAALDVIAWSTEVVAYQFHQSVPGNKHNLVMLLMLHKNLSIQGAMNLAGSMIKDAFASFCANEKRLLDNLENQPTVRGLFSWVYRPDSNPVDDTEVKQIKRYIRALKDCIAGNIHWLYETELFLGKKGSEVRTFGWVFVDSQAPTVPS
ncbi:hypothetical protein D9619_008467 [Psilocybe cf. subviscida]|uniref:Terpenoid synthase n=1 Tax=Psilocybe cf. subviscida TaxID=2480587 RepID=A0A8H5F0L8_9AGAR|nr:hypothetical protein D9619_008467 [Psilocybe cf. subviscida]